ncbi:RNA recognition motif domain-containing protein [Verrucomicrobiota bacterium]
MDIYVGNLPYSCADSDLQELFEQFGEVASARVIMDRETNRSKGFGFVGMPNNDEAQNAIDGTNDSEFMGRNLRVNEAQPREPSPRTNRSERW